MPHYVEGMHRSLKDKANVLKNHYEKMRETPNMHLRVLNKKIYVNL